MRLSIVDRVGWLTIDRPEKRNAMSTEMWQSLLRHIGTIDADQDVCAVVLRGVGGSFSAGGDLAELRTPDPEQRAEHRDLAEAVVLSLTNLRTPKIAQIDGPCYGAGCSLALACDIRICSPRAQFSIPALKNGLVYEPAFVRRLAQVVNSGPAGLLLLGDERWSGHTAAARGLVDNCTDDVPAAVERILTVLRGASPSAVASTAAAIRATTRSAP